VQVIKNNIQQIKKMSDGRKTSNSKSGRSGIGSLPGSKSGGGSGHGSRQSSKNGGSKKASKELPPANYGSHTAGMIDNYNLLPGPPEEIPPPRPLPAAFHPVRAMGSTAPDNMGTTLLQNTLLSSTGLSMSSTMPPPLRENPRPPDHLTQSVMRVGDPKIKRKPSGSLPKLSPSHTPPDSAKSGQRKFPEMESPRSVLSFTSAKNQHKVEWVPHTHKNPKHAKFCYMCLHGALSGKDVEEITLEDEVPSEVEMRNRGYLHPAEFRRLECDFTQNNVIAKWFRGHMRQQYEINIGEMEKLNKQIIRESHGTGYGTSYLYVESEEMRDWHRVELCFQLTESERAEFERLQIEFLRFCTATPLEDALGKHKPPKSTLPEIEYDVPLHIKTLVYEPPLDASKFNKAGQECINAAQAWSKVEGNIFDRHYFPMPAHKPFLGDFTLVYQKLTKKDIPEFPAYVPPKPPRPMIQHIGDPFPKPFFYIHEFEQEKIPTFQVDEGGSTPLGPCYFAEFPVLWKILHPPVVGPFDFPMPPLLDHPYLPPVDVISEGISVKDKKKVVKIRSIWESQLISGTGRCVPPIVERVKGMHFDLDFEKMESQRKMDTWVELTGAAEIADELIPIIPVRSMARFAPKEMKVLTPDFLRNVIWHDFVGQAPSDVINQRHEVILKEKERIENERLLKEQEELRQRQLTQEAAVETLEQQVHAFETIPEYGGRPEMNAASDLPPPLPEGVGPDIPHSAPAATNPSATGSAAGSRSGTKSNVSEQAGSAPQSEGVPASATGSAEQVGVPAAEAEVVPEAADESGEPQETPATTQNEDAPPTTQASETQGEAAESGTGTVPVQEAAPAADLGLDGTVPPVPEPAPVPHPSSSSTAPPASTPPVPVAPIDTAAPAAPVPLPPTSPTVHQALAGQLAQLQPLLEALPPDSNGGDGMRQALSSHHNRLIALVEDQKRDAQIENVLAQDNFIDKLADRIAQKLEIGKGADARKEGGAGSGGRNFKTNYDPNTIPTGDLSQMVTMTGESMTQTQKPVPLEFATAEEVAGPTDGMTNLPKALRGDNPHDDGRKKVEKPKDYTMEKARGDCYVRLLIEIEPQGAVKEIDPYQPQLTEPDDTLILQQRFLLTDENVSQETKEIFEDMDQSTVILFSFVRHNRHEAVQQLLEGNVELLTSLDEHGNTLLHVACQNNHRRMAKLLLKLGLNYDAQNKQGNTAMHYCYAFKFIPLAEILMQYGADPTIMNNKGLSPPQGLGNEDEDNAQPVV